MGKILEKIVDASLFTTSVVGSHLSKTYDGQYEHLMHGYGNDISLTFGVYFCSRLVGDIWRKNKWMNIAFGMGGCSAFEVAQYLGAYPGTFDPKDFLAYAVGSGAALGVDTILERTVRSPKTKPSTIPSTTKVSLQ